MEYGKHKPEVGVHPMVLFTPDASVVVTPVDVTFRMDAPPVLAM